MSDFPNLYDLTASQGDCPFEPGELVEQSGIYEVCHSDGPRETIVLLRGAVFRGCDCCRAQVRYRLVRSAPYIFEDQDFSPRS